MRVRFSTWLLFAVLALAGTTASAREAADNKPAADSPLAAAASTAPYDAELLRLAEILGALHFLRGICGTNDDQTWRDQMQALVDAETPGGERRDRMVASFNRGYRGFEQSYRVCTPAANLAIRRFLEEGTKISRDITARYAN